MIQSVDNNSAHPSSAAKASSSGSNGGASFASALASAQGTGTGTSSSHGTISGDLKTDLLPPKGETWGPVDGHTDYADILAGPRNGFFVSLTGPRKGQPFVIVHQHGKTFHVYGEGKHKVSIPVPTDVASLKPPKGETWKPVENHHDYKKIHGGHRANQFVNLSGNVRTGETFTIVHRDGKTFHKYGDHEVAVGGHRKPATTGNPSQPG
jgi:hypothetical protein